MENFKSEIRHLKLFTKNIELSNILVFTDQIIKSFLIFPLIKRLVWLKSLFQNLRPSLWKARPSFWGFKGKINLGRVFWKFQRVFCYNTAHAVASSQSKFSLYFTWRGTRSCNKNLFLKNFCFLTVLWELKLIIIY